MSFENKPCLLPWDTNRTYKATFKFLQDNQVNKDGTINLTSIYLGLTSLIDLNLENYTERQTVFNFIEGKILKVLNNSVVILGSSECGNSQYTLAYSDMQNIQNSIFSTKSEEYACYMNKVLPPLCKCVGNKNYDLLVDIRSKLSMNEYNENILFYFIYGGIFSKGYTPSELRVVKNVVLFPAGIVPITSILGYFQTENTITKEGK